MIIMPVSSWEEYKTLVIGEKGLKHQWHEFSNRCDIYANEGVFVWQITLLTSSDDYADFSANYRITGNKKIDAPITIKSLPPFAAKSFEGNNLYKRVVGIQSNLAIGDTEIIWECPFPWAKFMSIEFCGCEIGDTVSLYVLDSETGLISGMPNLQLNQFGFAANLCSGFYVHKSEFDADIYATLKIKLVYSSSTAKSIGINLVLNEVK